MGWDSNIPDTRITDWPITANCYHWNSFLIFQIIFIKELYFLLDKGHFITVDQHNQQELIPVIYAVVTNDTEYDAKYVMNFYEARGASENFNKELKNDFNARTLSHESFNTNDFEFLIKSLAYNLYHIFQMEVLEKDDQNLMMNTFRIRYQKIAAKVIHHARQMNLSFSSAYRNQNTFLRYYNKVVIQS